MLLQGIAINLNEAKLIEIIVKNLLKKKMLFEFFRD